MTSVTKKKCYKFLAIIVTLCVVFNPLPALAETDPTVPEPSETTVVTSANPQTGAASPETSAANPQKGKKWFVWEETGLILGNNKQTGTQDVFIPFWERNRNLVILDLRGHKSNGPEMEGNVGLAYRHIFGDKHQWILGVYSFFDVLQSANRNTYLQWMMGAEALTQNWDFRVNGYVPEGESHVISSTPKDASAFVSGHTLATTTRFEDIRERALAGFDIETGRKVPFLDRLPSL